MLKSNKFGIPGKLTKILALKFLKFVALLEYYEFGIQNERLYKGGITN